MTSSWSIPSLLVLVLFSFMLSMSPAKADWTLCADQYGKCSFTGTKRVLYGRSPTLSNVIKTFTNGTDCNNTVFGDPAVTFAKQCWYEVTAPAPVPATQTAKWILCAEQYGRCPFSGTTRVLYGRSPTLSNVVKTFANGTDCNNTIFGDPAPGFAKQCWYEEISDVPVSPSDPGLSQSGNWVLCASEHAQCSFNGTRRVIYGRTTTSANVIKTLTNGTYCDNTVFGDPAPTFGKQCWYEAVTSTAPSTPTPAPTPTPVTPTWVQCANEHAQCSFTGTRRVLYGRSTTSANVILTLANGTACSNDVFGDPAPGFGKICWYESVTTSAPTTPTPTPAPSTPSTPAVGNAGPRVTSFTNSGPITATAGQVISGVRISNPNGPCITIDAPNVVVRDSDIGPCDGEANINVGSGGTNALIEYNTVRQGGRGVMVRHATNVRTVKNHFTGEYFGGDGPISCMQEDGRNNGCSSAIEYDYLNGGAIDGNVIRGNEYGTDAISLYQSHGLKVINNDIDVGLFWKHASPLMIGDSYPGGDPGSNNYIADNMVRGSGGVPMGMLGSSGNTVVERNCFLNGVQIYAYNGNPLIGVTVRNNVIDMSRGRPSDTSMIAEWSTNINSTDCSRIPR